MALIHHIKIGHVERYDFISKRLYKVHVVLVKKMVCVKANAKVVICAYKVLYVANASSKARPWQVLNAYYRTTRLCVFCERVEALFRTLHSTFSIFVLNRLSACVDYEFVNSDACRLVDYIAKILYTLGCKVLS